jgi:hypothetical protein
MPAIKEKIAGLSLRFRIIISFLFVILLILAIVGGYGLYRERRNIHYITENKYIQGNSLVAGAINSDLKNISSNLLIISNLPTVESILRIIAKNGYDPENRLSYDELVSRL